MMTSSGSFMHLCAVLKILNTKYFILRRKRREWLPNLSSQRLMFKRSTNLRSNWNLEMLVFEEGGKPEYPEKNPRSKDETVVLVIVTAAWHKRQYSLVFICREYRRQLGISLFPDCPRFHQLLK